MIYQGHVYVLNTNGIMECLNLKTGEVRVFRTCSWPVPKQESWSSMILAGDHQNQSGETIVLRAQPKFELLGINALDGTLTNSSLAASDGQLFPPTSTFGASASAGSYSPCLKNLPQPDTGRLVVPVNRNGCALGTSCVV